jgi:signal transduction histidine kinase
LAKVISKATWTCHPAGMTPAAGGTRAAQRGRGLVLTATVGTASVAYALAGGVTPLTEIVGTILVAASFVAAGVLARSRRPNNPLGLAMWATGLCLLASLVQGPPIPALALIGVAAGTASGVLLGYLILSFPSGRLESRAHRAFLTGAALLIGLTNLARLAATGPIDGHANPYQLISDPSLAELTVAAEQAVTVGVLLGFLVLFLARWAGASRPARRVLAPVLLPSLLLVLTLVLSVLADAAQLDGELKAAITLAGILVRALVPIGFLVGLLRTRLTHAAIVDLILDIGQTPAPSELGAALSRALGDPALSVMYWSGEANAFIDSDEQPTALPSAESGQAVTILERAGATIAAIVHDPVLLEDPAFASTVAGAMRLAVENDRLHSEVDSQIEEVKASRARVVAAGDAERKRVERDLHDGAQQRLVALTLSLQEAQLQLGDRLDPAARMSLEQASHNADAALRELRDLARGIHPLVLTQAGLEPAVASLVVRSGLEIDLQVEPGRYASPLETTVYFLVSEALANMTKHANAASAHVHIHWSDGYLTVDVLDDGIGGADPAAGTGLRGIADRLAAVDGTLEVSGVAPHGTRLLARIPTSAPILARA